MKISHLIDRSPAPAPWSEGEKIPWDDVGFSRRMLREHLSQLHDAASRRTSTIDAQVSWIHDELLSGERTHILDLGCGPGLYANRLAECGHSVLGIDLSPASISYAEAQRQSEDARFMLADIRDAELPGPFGLALLLFGEANAFRPEHLENILKRTREALAVGGLLLVEAHSFEAVKRIGSRPPDWHTARSGLFSDDPYLCLHEAFWHEEFSAASERWHVVDLATSETTRLASSAQAYSEEQYRELLGRCGFDGIRTLPGMGAAVQEDLFVLVARAAA